MKSDDQRHAEFADFVEGHKVLRAQFKELPDVETVEDGGMDLADRIMDNVRTLPTDPSARWAAICDATPKQRPNKMTVMLSDDEYEMLDRLAHAQGVDKSAFIRRAIRMRKHAADAAACDARRADSAAYLRKREREKAMTTDERITAQIREREMRAAKAASNA